jgi:hypothetical protein
VNALCKAFTGAVGWVRQRCARFPAAPCVGRLQFFFQSKIIGRGETGKQRPEEAAEEGGGGQV